MQSHFNILTFFKVTKVNFSGHFECLFWQDPAGISRVSWDFWIQHMLKYKIPKVHAFIINFYT